MPHLKLYGYSQIGSLQRVKDLEGVLVADDDKPRPFPLAFFFFSVLGFLEQKEVRVIMRLTNLINNGGKIKMELVEVHNKFKREEQKFERLGFT